jgi:hypothetical protein
MIDEIPFRKPIQFAMFSTFNCMKIVVSLPLQMAAVGVKGQEKLQSKHAKHL